MLFDSSFRLLSSLTVSIPTMNRYPLWKNLLIGLVLCWGILYSLPNLYQEAPAVQISSAKATFKLDPQATVERVTEALGQANVEHTGFVLDENSVRVRFQNEETQIKAKDIIETALITDHANPSYVVALNLLSSAPDWLRSIRALPMYLGLDLRGGVHFLLQVDMPGALTKRMDATAGDLRTLLREKNIRHAGVNRDGQAVSIRFRDAEQREAARKAILASTNELQLLDRNESATDFLLIASLSAEAQKNLQEFAIKQNISTLGNRINELGVSEPIIQQQGLDRIVVQLPGVQDVAKAKEMLGRTATLEIRLVEDSPEALQQALNGTPPFGTELLTERGGVPILVKNQVMLTGDRLTDAQPGFDDKHQPAVHLRFDAPGSLIFKNVTRENIKRRMAIILIEQGKKEVVTAPVIQQEIGGGRVQISGSMTVAEASEIALLLRSGSLAAPMEIIEERIIGPSMGAENIVKGFHSTLWGFIAIVIFMCVYYQFFGFISSIALAANLVLLIALLSLLQATLTLPGIAAMALTLGMAIDANVLINERIREELRHGASPHAAISMGYERAFGTILDSNVTSFIAGIALLVFGSGPIRGFAVVHCLGILTSMFSSVLVSRLIVNLIYGRRHKIERLSIGQIWKPNTDMKQ